MGYVNTKAMFSDNKLSGFVNRDIPMDALGQILFFFSLIYTYIYIQAKHSVSTV